MYPQTAQGSLHRSTLAHHAFTVFGKTLILLTNHRHLSSHMLNEEMSVY